MDILCNIIRCTQPPLSEALLNSVFPVVVNTILASDDNSVLQVLRSWSRTIMKNMSRYVESFIVMYKTTFIILIIMLFIIQHCFVE